MPSKLPLPQKRGLFLLFHSCPRTDRTCAAIMWQNSLAAILPLDSQTCLGANVLSGLVPSTVFEKNFWAFLRPCVWGSGRPWYGTSAQPESHFTCSSPRGAPWVVPSTFLLNSFWAFIGALGRGEGARLVRYLCKTHKSLHGRHV